MRIMLVSVGSDGRFGMSQESEFLRLDSLRKNTEKRPRILRIHAKNTTTHCDLRNRGELRKLKATLTLRPQPLTELFAYVTEGESPVIL